MQFYTSDDIPTNLDKRSFAANITRIMPNGSAPLFAISGLAKKKTALQIQHGYWKKTAVFANVVISGSHASGLAVLTVDSTSNIVTGQILRHQIAYGGSSQQHTTLAELIMVNTVDSSTQLSVERGYAGTSAATIADNAVLIVIGSAHEQGSNAPTSVAILPVLTNNLTQIFRNTWDLTGTVAATEMEVGYGVVAENKADAASFHAQDIEKAAFFSVSVQDTFNGRPRTTMDGIEELIKEAVPTHLWEAGSTTTYTQLETILEPVFDNSTDAMHGNVRTLFVGGTAMKVINNIGRLSGTYQLQNGATSFGLQFKQFKTARGTFNVIEHPLFNAHADWKKMVICMDLSSFDFAYLKGRDTFHTDINTNAQSTSGKDAQSGVITSELTIELRNPLACAIIYNLRAAA